MPNDIPTKRREQVRNRESGRCFRCNGPGRAWHHRRRRRVADKHQHCSCNGVLLCNTCHTWVHAHPALSVSEGLIVSSTTEYPGAVAAMGVWLSCEGTYETEITNGNEG